jgi:hypothetical protein
MAWVASLQGNTNAFAWFTFERFSNVEYANRARERDKSVETFEEE